jgi:phosphoribosylanthranilate isomerase
MEVKICGITNLINAQFAAAIGADAVGFIFYKNSPRYVAPETVAHIIKNLPEGLCKVGVFVNQDAQEIRDIANLCGLSMIQLHGDESPEFCAQFPASRLIKAVTLTDASELEALKHYPVKAILVDSRKQDQFGGTGEKANWDLAPEVKKTHPLILAGGLHAGNIGTAVAAVAPHAVDLNSGVEIAPGKKNHRKLRLIFSLMHQMRENQPEEMNSKIFCKSFEEPL